MASADVELVRRMHEALTCGGFAAAAEFAHPDFQMRLMVSHPLGAALRDPGDATRAMAGFMESFDDFRAEAEEFVDAGDDRVVVAFRERGRPRGGSVELDQRFGILYTLRDGKIVRMEWFDSFDEALAAARAEV